MSSQTREPGADPAGDAAGRRRAEVGHDDDRDAALGHPFEVGVQARRSAGDAHPALPRLAGLSEQAFFESDRVVQEVASRGIAASGRASPKPVRRLIGNGLTDKKINLTYSYIKSYIADEVGDHGHT